MSTVISEQPKAIDIIRTSDVNHTVVDFKSTTWAYENCRIIFDHPYTVKTITLGKDSYMYSILKFSPGLYLCRVNSNCPDIKNQIANCRLELLEKGESQEDGSCPTTRRHGCLCKNRTDLSLLITTDTNIECRIIFENRIDVRIPTFMNIEVRSKQHIVMPLRLKHVKTGMNQYKHTMTYRLDDIHFILKKTLYAIHWLSSLEKDIDALSQLISNPLWDMNDPRSENDYSELVQEIQSSITEKLPHTFISNSFLYKIHMLQGIRIPLISQTLAVELLKCFRHKKLNIQLVSNVLRQSLKYINFLLIDFTEFKCNLSEKITTLCPDDVKSSTITITV